MTSKPMHLDLRSDDRSIPPRSPRGGAHLDLPSPRVGEVPPALSPLDAFALRSRMLAQQFEQNQKDGRRISRLPSSTVQREMANRPGYFRSFSGESGESDASETPRQEDYSSNGQMGGNENKDRPISYYPTLEFARPDTTTNPLSPPVEEEEPGEQRPARQADDYFGAPRADSPEPVDPKSIAVGLPSPNVPSLTGSVDSMPFSHPRTLTDGSIQSQRSERGLLAPKSPAYPRSPRSFQSIRSVRQDSGDEDPNWNPPPVLPSASRKFSGSSNPSRPQSPFSPYAHPLQRSPSMTSEYSMTGSQTLQKPAFNFSRPLSSAGSRPSVDTRPSFDSRPSFDTRMPSYETRDRQPSNASTGTYPSAASVPSRQASGDEVPRLATSNLQRSETATSDSTADETPFAAPTYTHTKFALPRGRVLDRTSVGNAGSWMEHQFARAEQEAAPIQLQQPPPMKRHDTDNSLRSLPTRPAAPATSVKASHDDTRLGRQCGMSSAARSRSADPRGSTTHATQLPSFPSTESNQHKRATPSVQTTSTDRTIRPSTQHKVPLHARSASADLTPEAHLEIGIAAHTAGNVTKSTYHLRLAARAGLPTGMLLYALACRHGWGMRPNQEEGVLWLRRAIDSSGLEADNVETTLRNVALETQAGDAAAAEKEKRERKAQMALAVYELGISYMNGWGCGKDRSLALRCFEVAGGWGDCDALAEAGFCYMQGLGCRTDKKKAAGFYRRAAEGGMSMAGNSW